MREQYCTICEEGIFNPICPNCLKKEVLNWVQESAPKAVKKIKEIFDSLISTLEAKQVKMRCIVCKREIVGAACPFCVIKDLFYAIKRFQPNLSGSLRKLFNFDFGPTEVGSTCDYWQED